VILCVPFFVFWAGGLLLIISTIFFVISIIKYTITLCCDLVYVKFNIGIVAWGYLFTCIVCVI